ncbi:hypothetical protein GF374_03390 [Candidatus Woesearchaeota archaeon]|nr:hypothetical protein [Candidatus Woesearchaeota archaeon]
MSYCDECDEPLDMLPFKCKRCGGSFCAKHRMPENHHCPGLQKGNVFVSGFKQSKKPRPKKKTHHYTHKKPNHHHTEHKEKKQPVDLKSKINRYWSKTKHWFRRRKGRGYLHYDKLAKSFLWLAAISIVILILYSNIAKINEIIIWFIPLGGALLLVTAYFWIKLFIRFIKNLSTWYKYQRNWLKYLVIAVIIVLLLLVYVNREPIITKGVEKIKEIKLSNILPLKISDEIPQDSPLSAENMKNLKTKVVESVDQAIDPDPISDKTKEIEQAILKYTNAERKKQGLSALSWDSKLADIAREHSLDMANNNFFSHDNLRGEDPTARAIRNGYNVHKELGGGWYSEGIAENIGKMPTGSITGGGYVANNADSIAKAHVDSWMDSPGHRANILEKDYTRLGVGIAFDGTYYVGTQNFY